MRQGSDQTDTQTRPEQTNPQWKTAPRLHPATDVPATKSINSVHRAMNWLECAAKGKERLSKCLVPGFCLGASLVFNVIVNAPLS